MSRCLIALGGNKGDVVATMDAALDLLDECDGMAVTSVSRVYETAPVGADSGDPFLNAAAELDTTLPPREILAVLKIVEYTLGRRVSERWTSRIIDLDLLLDGSTIMTEPGLTLPHPHLWYRRFVLDPLADVAGDVVHPVFGVTIGELREQLLSRPLTVVICGGCAEDRLAVGSVLRRAGIEVAASPPEEQSPLRLIFEDGDEFASTELRAIELETLPGSLIEAAQSVVTATLDEPQVHKRPLRRMP